MKKIIIGCIISITVVHGVVMIFPFIPIRLAYAGMVGLLWAIIDSMTEKINHG